METNVRMIVNYKLSLIFPHPSLNNANFKNILPKKLRVYSFNILSCILK